MADEYQNPNSIKSLNVLPNSGKVDQLRKELAGAVPKKLNETTLVDRAIDSSKTPDQKALEEKIIEAVKTVYDPEIPVNIYELGLIYEINVDPETSAVFVKMTLTAPGCPVAGTLPVEVRNKIEAVPGVTS